MAPSWVTRIEHEEDDVGFIDDFVQHADVVSPLPFLRLVGSCRCRVGRGRWMSLADAEETEMGNAHTSVSQRGAETIGWTYRMSTLPLRTEP
jgi:hypothetical protein